MGIFGGSPHGTPQDRVDLDHLRDRVTKLEASVARLQARQNAEDGAATGPLQVTPADTWLLEVRELKAQGKTIHAIKLYREHTGLGLKEAKDAVEALY